MQINESPRPDMLGEPYTRQDIVAGDRWDPCTVATLVRRPVEGATKAVLWIHGFSDYFFHTHVAEAFAARGVETYGIDLRRHGRSLRPGQMPNFCTDMSDYYAELDAAMRIIRQRHQQVLLTGHSTGGLLAAVYSHDRDSLGWIEAVVLNSPWFDIAGSPRARTWGTRAMHTASRVDPRTVIPIPQLGIYGQSLHQHFSGEWNYDLNLKPVKSAPIRAGWLSAVRRAHARVHAGLDISVPVLLLASGRSRTMRKYEADAHDVDVVLDVDHMIRWAPGLGDDVCLASFEGAVHDVTLSKKAVREEVLDLWWRWWQDPTCDPTGDPTGDTTSGATLTSPA